MIISRQRMEKTFEPVSDSSGKTDLSRFNNDWYDHGPRWKVISWFIVNTLLLNNHLPVPVGLKIAALRWFGAKIGQHVMIKPGASVKYPWQLTIGDYVWIGENVWIDNLSMVTIGNNACLSQGAMILTGNHDYSRSTFDLVTKPIHIAEGAWIGAQSVVCPGITCHSHSVLAVGSVATRNLEAYGIYQGNPAVWVRKRVIRA